MKLETEHYIEWLMKENLTAKDAKGIRKGRSLFAPLVGSLCVLCV
jgi:hypothetical protein